MKTIVASIFVTLAASGGAQMCWEAALSREAMNAKGIEVYLVEALETSRVVTVKGTWNPTKQNYSCPAAATTFRVLDRGPGAEEREFAGIVPANGMMDGMPTFRKGKRFLLIAVAACEGKFAVSSGSAVFGWKAEIEAKAGQDRCVLLALETRATELPKGLTGADLVTSAILDCLDPMTDAKVHQIVKLLCTALPEQKTRPSALPPDQRPFTIENLKRVTRDMASYAPDGPLTRKLRAKAEATTHRYRKSKLYELLVRWRVPGSVAPYVKSLEPFLRDTSAYTGPEDYQKRYWGLIDPLYEYMDLDGRIMVDFDRQMPLVLQARNTNVLLYWLTNIGVGLMQDASQIRRYARLLDYPDQRVQYHVATVLASQLNEPNQAPKLYGLTSDGVRVDYPDLAEKIAYWKKRLGLE